MTENEGYIEAGKKEAKKIYHKIIKPARDMCHWIDTHSATPGPPTDIVIYGVAGAIALCAVSSMPFAFFAGVVSEKIKGVGQVEKAEGDEAKLVRDYCSR